MMTTTNAIRKLEGMGIALEVRTYEPDEDDLSAGRAAAQQGTDGRQLPRLDPRIDQVEGGAIEADDNDRDTHPNAQAEGDLGDGVDDLDGPGPAEGGEHLYLVAQIEPDDETDEKEFDDGGQKPDRRPGVEQFP